MQAAVIDEVPAARAPAPEPTGALDVAKRTTTSYLVLALMARRDWTAYELAVEFGRGIDVLWARASRQLYNVPKRLVQEGLASARSEVIAPSKRHLPGARRRTVYSITDEGRAALREWHASEPAPPTMEFESMVRMMFPDGATIDDFRRNLEHMAEQARSLRAIFVDHSVALMDVEDPLYPERHHLFAMANRFCVDHFNTMEAFATWALEHTADWTEPLGTSKTLQAQTQETLREVLDRAEQAPGPRHDD